MQHLKSIAAKGAKLAKKGIEDIFCLSSSVFKHGWHTELGQGHFKKILCLRLLIIFLPKYTVHLQAWWIYIIFSPKLDLQLAQPEMSLLLFNM